MIKNNDLYSYLVKNEGFYMNQYLSKVLGKYQWICVKNINGKLYAVIVTDEGFEDINISESKKYLNSLGKPYGLNVIIYSKGEYIQGEDPYVSRLVYDTSNKNIILKEGTVEPLCRIFNIIESKKEEKEKKKSFKEFFNSSRVTFAIVFLNVLIFIITAICSKNIIDIDSRVLLEFGAKESYAISNGEYYRLITSAFLHGGLMHLVVNMYSLIMVGSLVEKIYGWKKYLVIYLFSGVTSSLLSYYLNSDSISIGASGAIFGVLGAVLVFALKEKENINKSFIRDIISVIAINLLIGFSVSNIDNFGHIGGFIGGVVLSFILYKRN